jgi:non-heme chloroperoxidase
MSFVTVGKENKSDIKIHYTDHGQGEPLVLIHGYPFSGTAWEKEEAKFLEEGYRVITYDRRGFGLSSKPASGYNYDTFANDLDVLLNELSLRNVTLIGHSMGTGEITRYLGNYGAERVKSAVFISPIPPFILKTDDNPNGVDRDIFEGFKNKIQEDRYAFITEFLKNFYNLGLGNIFSGSHISDEKLRADFSLACSSSPFGFYKCVDTWLTDFRSDIPKITVPCLIIQGDKDQILPIEKTGEVLAKQLTAKLAVIPGGSHGIPWTHADDICEEVLSFLAPSESLRPIRETIERPTPSLH